MRQQAMTPAAPQPEKGRTWVSRVGDADECAADRVADELARATGDVPLDSGSQPAALLATAGQRLGFDFSALRIHRDGDAARAAAGVRARAFTTGTEISFGAGEFAPATSRGRWLFFHELAHVAQQMRGTASSVVQRAPVTGSSTEQLHSDLEAQYAREHGGVQPRGGAHGEDYGNWMVQPSYDAAVRLVQAKDPVLYGYLAQGRVGQGVQVRSVTVPITGGGPRQPTTLEFRFVLRVVHGTQRAGSAAEFAAAHEVVDRTPSVITITLPMSMHFNSRSGPNASAELAEALYHEGIHMLLAMDRTIENLVPGSTRLQSGKLASLQAMRNRIRNHRSFATLEVDLQTYIGTRLANTGMPPAQAATQGGEAAERIIDGILEERFAIDEQRRQFPGRPVQNVTNAAIAQAYLPNELLNEGIVVNDPAVLARMTMETTAMLDLISHP